MENAIRVLVPLSEGFEEIEAVTVIDVLRRAGFEVVVASLHGREPVRGSNGVVLLPDAALADVIDQAWTLVALPGGMRNTANLSAHEPLLQLLRERFSGGKLLAAICAAPKVLQAAGLAPELELTSHPVVRGDLTGVVRRYREEEVVEDRQVITSRGAGTAMQWALRLVERLGGTDLRERVEVALALRQSPE